MKLNKRMPICELYTIHSLCTIYTPEGACLYKLQYIIYICIVFRLIMTCNRWYTNVQPTERNCGYRLMGRYTKKNMKT